ncbi:hypothetical protein MmiHf6_00790 [Methanimicrococcus hongohii]|uniref:DUF3137 domain-containing protein n=2 Tax=Methanimicrococcus hongohii TaxID=3028295 RepID=A0AA96UY69_9EURY|nr:hypothetical protein MmiHf6_00790 [Methanimicrococcus sp. Hf6]
MSLGYYAEIKNGKIQYKKSKYEKYRRTNEEREKNIKNNPHEVIEYINYKINFDYSLAQYMFFSIVFIVIFLLIIIHPIIFIVVEISLIVLSLITYAIYGSGRPRIMYILDEESYTDLERLYDSFEELQHCQKIRHIISSKRNYDYKYHAGAGFLVDSRTIKIGYEKPKYIKTNMTRVPYIKLKSRIIYFFPDQLMIFENRRYEAIPYNNLHINLQNKDWIEDGNVPIDATIIGYRWQHPNIDGSPDLRFRYNPKLPILNCREIEIIGDRIEETLQFSNKDIGTNLYNEFTKYSQKYT